MPLFHSRGQHRFLKRLFLAIKKPIRKSNSYRSMLLLMFLLGIYAIGFQFTSATNRGRALDFLILMMSVFVALCLFRLKSRSLAKILGVVATIFILVSMVTYPLRAYPQEALLSYSKSEDKGNVFLTSFSELDAKTLSIWRPERLLAYVNLTLLIGFRIMPFPPDFNTSTDMTVFKQSAYYEISMIIDLSFSNNSYTRSHNIADTSPSFDRVYSCGTYDIYVKSTS